MTVLKNPDIKFYNYALQIPIVLFTVPSSYASAASNSADNDALIIDKTEVNSSQLLCPFSANKECRYGDDCQYVHGNNCELCGLAVLLPGNDKQNEEHMKVNMISCSLVVP